MKRFALASYGLYFLAGLVMTTIGSVMPQLLAHYDISYTSGGQLILLGSLGFMIGVPISTYLMGKMKETTVLSLAGLLIAAAQLGIMSLPSFGAVRGLQFMNSIGASMVETVVATLMMEVFIGRRAVVMSYLEVSFGVGALLMPLIASVLIASGGWRFAFLVTGLLAIVMAVVWKFVTVSKQEKPEEGQSMDAEVTPPQGLTKRGKIMLLSMFVFMIMMYAGVETNLNNFLSSIFASYFGEASYLASLSIGTYWVAMVAGRLATGWIIRKVTYDRYLLWSMLGTLAGFMGLLLFKQAIFAYVLVAFLGLTMSGVYSITMVYANHSLPGLARLVTSMITGFAGLGGAVFPAVVGYAMDHADMSIALWLMAGFTVLFLVALLGVIGVYRKGERPVLRPGSEHV